MRQSIELKRRAKEKFDAVTVRKMIGEGLQAATIATRTGTDEMEVRRWAKRHRLGKKLEENEGCVTRKATAAELSAAEAMIGSVKDRPPGNVAHFPKEPEDPEADWSHGPEEGLPPFTEPEMEPPEFSAPAETAEKAKSKTPKLRRWSEARAATRRRRYCTVCRIPKEHGEKTPDEKREELSAAYRLVMADLAKERATLLNIEDILEARQLRLAVSKK